MASKRLNWGLLSTAHINRRVIPAIKASKRSRLVAVASRSQAKAEAYAREWKIPRALGSYQALLDNPDIDVVYISLPNRWHAEWTIKALRAGKHVLCEKPLAMTVEEVDAMAAAASESGRVLAEAFMYRHHAQTLRVQEIVENGGAGRLLFMQGAFTFTISNPEDIRLHATAGGGSLRDVGCYPISYARMLVGQEPVEVFGWQVAGEGGVDETFVGQLRFPNDVFVQFEAGFRAPGRSFMEIVGTEGVLGIPTPFTPGDNEQIILRRGDRAESFRIKGKNLYSGEIEDMADAVLLAKAPRISLADSRGNVAAIVALLESARTGRAILL